MKKSYEERFWEKTVPEPNSGCVLWTGTVDERGYARVFIPGPRRRGNCFEKGHQVALRLAGRSVPPGHEPDHTCRVRSCVNERHLDVVPHRVNSLRGVGACAMHARKTACPKCGGPYVFNGRERRCPPCTRDRSRAAQARYRRRHPDRIREQNQRMIARRHDLKHNISG